MLINVAVKGRQVRALLAQNGAELGDTDVFTIEGAHATEQAIESSFGEEARVRFARRHCDRDHSAEDWPEPDEARENLDTRDLGEFVLAVMAGERAGAMALATRLFIDGELVAVEVALRRMKVAA